MFGESRGVDSLNATVNNLLQALDDYRVASSAQEKRDALTDISCAASSIYITVQKVINNANQ